MQDKVTIEPDESGSIIRISMNNPEFGYVRVTQESVSFTANGWVKKAARGALIHGTVEDLKSIGIAKLKTLPGKIYILESTDPFNTKDPDRDLKIAGDTGVVCCSHGEPIYRKSFYDASGLLDDSLVPHTNGEDIKEAQSTESVANTADTSGHEVSLSTEQLAEIKEGIDEEVEESKEEEVDEEPVEETVEEEEKDDSFEL